MALFDDARNQDSEFRDRRRNSISPEATETERRQFGNSHFGLSPEALELAEAIDTYKVKNRRRFITCEEMLHVVQSLGYAKPSEAESQLKPAIQ